MSWFDVGIDIKNRTSGIIKTKCPKCHPVRKNKTDDSLYVNISKGFAICYNCGWVYNLKADERFKKVREKADLPKETPAYSKAFLTWWEERGISEATLQETYTYERRMHYQGLRNGEKGIVICFPVFYKFNVVNVKYRALNSKVFRQLSADDGAMQVLSGLDSIEEVNETREDKKKRIKRIILVEGEVDRLSYWEAGIKVVTLPSGATASLPWWNEEMSALFDCVEEVILATDNDAPGIMVRDELARRIGKAKCKYVVFPVGCKDANDVIREWTTDDSGARVKGANAHLPHKERLKMLVETVKNAKPVPYEGIVLMRDANQHLDAIFTNKLTPGWKRGQQTLDRRFTYKKQLLYVITGAPGTGKSHFVISDLNELAEYQMKFGIHLKFGIYSPENKNPGRLAAKIISLKSGMSFVYNHPNYITRDAFHQGKRFVSEHYVMLFPEKIAYNKNPNTLEGILELAEVGVKQHGINGLVIDPWNKIEHDLERGETENNYISRQLDMIYEKAEKLDIFVCIVAHPTKPVNRDKSGNMGRITMYSISGSANWYNKPDVGIILHRDKFDKDGVRLENGPTEIIVEKMRFEEIGSEGKAEMWYDWYRAGRFVDDDLKLAPENWKKTELKEREESNFEQIDIDDVPF